MDFLVRHWAPFARRFPSPLPVVSTEFLRAKNHWLRRRFDTCNFSLVLRGGGKFRRLGQTWEVAAPCVITQWPGEDLAYGPANGHDTWDECYVIYSARTRRTLERCGFIDESRPVWPIRNPGAVEAHLRELRRLTHSPQPELVADHVDRVWERILLETLTSPGPAEPDEGGVRAIYERLREDPARPVDFAALARKEGLSPSTFRRQWMRVFASPPARTVQELRMREACQRLATTAESVKRIAGAVGYDDEFHFSRRFRAHTGMPPTEYRRVFRLG